MNGTPPKPAFGITNKYDGTLVFLDDGTVLQATLEGWREIAPLPRTVRAAEAEASK